MKFLILSIIALIILITPSFAYAQADSEQQNQFSQQKIKINPGDTITVDNDDGISHSILSGKEVIGPDNSYLPDGRISTGVINPGDSVDITFIDRGFYKLYDPDYPWMKMTVYVFLDNPNNNAKITIPMVTEPVQEKVPEIQASNQVVDNDMLIQTIQLQNDLTLLQNENDHLLDENTKLKIDNEKLQNQTSIQQAEIINLQNIIHEQIRVIMEALISLKN